MIIFLIISLIVIQAFSYVVIGYLVYEIRDTLTSSVDKLAETYLEKITLEAENRQREIEEAEQADPTEIKELTPEEEFEIKRGIKNKE